MNLLPNFLFAVEIDNFGAKFVMTSLDIEIFLTTISLDEASENFVDKLFFNKDTVHSFTKKRSKRTSQICCPYFIFQI